MKINPFIFKAYDIRGLYPAEINEDVTYQIARAFAVFLRGKKKRQLRIVVSSDNRISSPSLRKSIIRGLREQGASVIDIRLATTPMFYFAVAHYGFDGGIQVSASHNPSQWNGLKLVGKGAEPIGEKTGLREILRITQGGRFLHRREGKIKRKNVLGDYVAFNLRGFSLVKAGQPFPTPIVIDTANAVPGIVLPQFLKDLSVPFLHLNARLDGRFPSHQPDPLRPENLIQLQAAIKKNRAAFGAAFDGDGDRIIFCDEEGRAIPGDLITAMIAGIILKKHPGAKIGYDIRSSRVVKEAIRQNGGVPVVTKVGHSFIKDQMRKEHIFFAGELSGHYYVREHYFSEAPLFVLREILGEIRRTGKKFSELIAAFRLYAHSGEINFKVQEKERVMKRIEKFFEKGKITRLDGVRIDFRDWWFLVRPSNTEPLLRLIVEAKHKRLLGQKKKALVALIKKKDLNE